MTCEHSKKRRIKFLGAKPGEIRTLEDRRLVTRNPKLLQDRIEVASPMWICGEGRPLGECGVHLCDGPATHECDGCDIPICQTHAARRGTQWIESETGFRSPGFSRMAVEDSYDLCPFCMFMPDDLQRSGNEGGSGG